jgi:polyisoprenoid-binding protein YceI
MTLTALETQPSTPISYEIDSAHSSATFKVRHLMVSNVRGELGPIVGQVLIDETDLTRSRVDATIDASRISTRDEKRDEHLRSSDFLDVKSHPSFLFHSTLVRHGKTGHLLVTGELTIRGVTREVTLDVEPLSPDIRDPWGNVKRGVTATTKINRKDFGVSWNAALDGGGVVVGDEVTITLEVELGRKS